MNRRQFATRIASVLGLFNLRKPHNTQPLQSKKCPTIPLNSGKPGMVLYRDGTNGVRWRSAEELA